MQSRNKNFSAPLNRVLPQRWAIVLVFALGLGCGSEDPVQPVRASKMVLYFSID